MDDWDCEQDDRNSFLMNDQLYNFLCLNLKDEFETKMKNMKVNLGV